MKAPRIRLARLPTALEPLDRLSEQLKGPRIWLKRDDTTDTPGSGNKLRKLEFSVGQARSEHATVLITSGGVQSNHCRATAMVAARLGLKCHLILRGRPGNDGNLLLDYLFGASITYVSNEEFRRLDDLYTRTAAHYTSLGETPFCIPIGASDEIGMWGYIEAAAELKQDFLTHRIAPGFVLSATGSGGTLAGLIVGNERHQLNTEIVAFNVSDNEAYFQKKISGDIGKWQQRYREPLNNPVINVIDGYVGPGYGRADEPVYSMIRQVAKSEGVIFDPVYTGKAFAAMVTELKQGRFYGTSDIVFIHTGGIFGLFPSRDELMTIPGT